LCGRHGRKEGGSVVEGDEVEEDDDDDCDEEDGDEESFMIRMNRFMEMRWKRRIADC
jgi:hypothetical protein